MRTLAVSMLLMSLAGPGGAQETPRIFPGDRLLSLTAGVGNAMGWFGVQGERYLLDERISVFAGLGYTPQLDPGDPAGPTFAAGLRSFTSGLKYRLFVEMSASQVVTVTGGGQDGSRVPRGLDPWATQVGLGLGYTWRRLPRIEGPERKTM